MIEYYAFKHRGDAATYDDALHMCIIPTTTMVLYYGSHQNENYKRDSEMLTDIFASDYVQSDFSVLCQVLEATITKDAEYMLLRISDSEIISVRCGDIGAKIVMGGEMRSLPNGRFGLHTCDRIVCGTGKFFEKLTDEAILCDALVSEDCSEWMNLMVRRISDVNELRCGNLTAVNFIVRGQTD